MATLIIDDHYRPYVNDLPTVEAAGSSIREVLSVFYNTFPQLMVFMFDNKGAEASRMLYILDDEAVIEPDDLYQVITEETTIHILVAPTGEYGAVVAIMEVVWDLMPAVWASIPTWAETAINIALTVGLMVALNVVMGALVEDIAPPSINSGSLGNSATYTFNGIKNTTAAGTPIQIVYGKCRTGGNILSLFTEGTSYDENSQFDETELYYQIGLCEGEIEEVSDVYINKMPDSFYNAVSTYPTKQDFLRKGTKDQAIMSDFNKIINTTSLNRKIANASTEITSTVISSDTTSTPVYGIVVGSTSYPTQLTLGKFEALYNFVPEPQG